MALSDEAIFTGFAGFRLATFARRAEFIRATFRDGASFDEATFLLTGGGSTMP
jgi:hypothetical protein